MGQKSETPRPVVLKSSRIESVSLLARRPFWTRLYALPFALLYPALLAAYCLGLIFQKRSLLLVVANAAATHALVFLLTRWNITARARVSYRTIQRLADAEFVFVRPLPKCGRAEIVPVEKDGGQASAFVFSCQRYAVQTADPAAFAPVAYPCNSAPTFDALFKAGGSPARLRAWYGPNRLDIPTVPPGASLAELVCDPLFLFQVVCAVLWVLDGYLWWSGLALGLFCLMTHHLGRICVRFVNLQELRRFVVKPSAIQVLRGGQWSAVRTDALYPGDVVSVTAGRAVPADMLLFSGYASVKEDRLVRGQGVVGVRAVAPRSTSERVYVDGAHYPNMLFACTRVVECAAAADPPACTAAPDGGALALVLRTGFGTRVGRSVRNHLLATDGGRAPPRVVPHLTTAFIFSYAVLWSGYVWFYAATVGGQLPRALECALVVATAAAFCGEVAYVVTPVLEYIEGIFAEHRMAFAQVMLLIPRGYAVSRALLWLACVALPAEVGMVAHMWGKRAEAVDFGAYASVMTFMWMQVLYLRHLRAILRECERLIEEGGGIAGAVEGIVGTARSEGTAGADVERPAGGGPGVGVV